ncbi:MAG: sulfatase-like hydrolase/transferase [Armatimonadetes bacterium]|nr:sulfatase-like hydrolase/transferase [Armatimonadota bacterium]
MPNDILVLMTDQHRADWIGAFGGKHVRTPNLDSLASEGAIFTRCLTTSPICMPARTSFLTGQYPHNFGMWDNIGRLQDTSESCLHSLKNAGYRTCHVGKSHLYPHGGKDLRDEEPYMHALGWDDVLETTGPLSTVTTKSILTDWMEKNGIYQTFLDDYQKRREVGNSRALWPSPLPNGMLMDDFIAQTALEYIQQSDSSKPLYLFVGLGGPHDPWDPPQSWDTYRLEDMPMPLERDPTPNWLAGTALEYQEKLFGRNKDLNHEQWARMRTLYSARVSHLDYLIGRIIDTWHKVRGKSSWIIFWSDHGEMLGDKGRTGKCVFFDPVVRVPAIIRPPNGTAGPIQCNKLVSLPDLTATILDVAGCEPGRNVFGKSLIPVFGDSNQVGRNLVVSELFDLTMVYDGRWKLVLNSQNEVVQLFDTVQDPTESLNLACHEKSADIINHLRHELLQFLLSTNDRQYREVNG